MRDGVVILNCARGEIVETADMVTALNSGKLGGYGTDVLDVEPPPADHPLLSAKNCIVTPAHWIAHLRVRSKAGHEIPQQSHQRPSPAKATATAPTACSEQGGAEHFRPATPSFHFQFHPAEEFRPSLDLLRFLELQHFLRIPLPEE